MKRSATNMLVNLLLHLMAAFFNYKRSLKKYLKSDTGWINFAVGFKTENDTVAASIIFKNGKVRVLKSIPESVDVVLIFTHDAIIKEMLRVTPNKVLIMLLNNKMRVNGNLSYLNLFNFYISLLMGRKHRRQMEKEKREKIRELQRLSSEPEDLLTSKMKERGLNLLKADKVDPGVSRLPDPYLSGFSLNDFPRLKEFLDIHFEEKPEICHERAKLLTDWFKEYGFENDNEGRPWIPELRQAHAFRYLMKNRKPIIRKNDLIAGTTTTKEIGVVIYPDSHGTMIWGELASVPFRELNPYSISEETIDILHSEVLPYWTHRNFREWVRERYNNPLCQRLDERFAVYFLWKTVALSHTIPDFPKILRLGTRGIVREIKAELKKSGKSDNQKINTLQAMILSIEGLTAYATNLSNQAEIEAHDESNPVRKAELIALSKICSRVPENPALTLEEAVNAVWIVWVGLHMENTNAGLSLGRLDQWLQPYFEADIKRIKSKAKREKYIKHAVELIGCFYMRCTDHLPLVPDIGNYLFGGSSSDQAITLGGVTPVGRDAVNDMTYIFLKVTEMLGIRDPNVNARFNISKNSDAYLKRLCEVNLITAATPSMHNDEAVMTSLKEFRYRKKDLRDWSATGCVEPTLSGKHMGHTNCMMMNMVAALEMAMNNGRHPLMNWDVRQKTGNIEKGDFLSFDEFFTAFTKQLKFLIDNSIEYNNILGEAHRYIRPTPFLSSLIEGCIVKGKDATKGGAIYNSSGSACIGLTDVTDSLMAVKTLVFDEKKVPFSELIKAIDNNFKDNKILHAQVMNKVPLFGSGSDEAVEMANRVIKFVHDCFGRNVNYRGGRYTAGFWSMSNHVAFGTLSGALPSGRLAGKAFTPGLTPQPNASKNLLDNMRDVACLEPGNMNNNIAFNVKVVPGVNDTHKRIIDNMYSYVKSYFSLGGMQMQMNVLTSAVLRDAMAHPENYRNLLVRISGYNAYFATLNRDMQIELIERAEYGI